MSRYKNAKYSNLTDVELVRKFRELRELDPNIIKLLSKAEVNYDIVRLEKLINKAGNDISKLDTFWQVVNGNKSKFVKFVDYLDEFKGAPIDPNIKPRYFDNPNNEFKDINMQHILDKHTLEHFDFNNKQNLGTSVDMFKPGTTQRQVMDYVDEALNKLRLDKNKGIKYPMDNVPEKLKLKSGLEVFIGSRTVNGKRVIGQFYPVAGADMVSFSQNELKAIRKILY